MGEAGEGNLPHVSLQSKEHEELLDVIDHLRRQGVGGYIDLPQLIVCGDQSSGKSSVLEAISGVKFPVKDNLCTRFATELILRRGPEAATNITIVSEDNHTKEEIDALQTFKAVPNALDDFDSLIDSAKTAMGIDKTTKNFSKDVLRIEITGPKQPHLTLVDLPGLYRAGSRDQSDEDAAAVDSLVQSYMKKPRSIILAVVSAKVDFALQIVTRYARDVDRHGSRTLGIITKPDTLHEGSESERGFLELAENRDVNFRLGWHCVVNRDFTNRDCSSEERDRREEEFLSSGVWASLPRTNVGIKALRPRLSRVLQDQILVELPKMVQEVESGIDHCHIRLERLGGPRATLREQRRHLGRISHDFSSLVKAAIDGNYNHAFFGDPRSKEGYSKRLRAVVQNSLLEFADTMRRKGHAKKIVEELLETNSFDAQHDEPVEILRSDYLEEVQDLMKRTRGRELPGTFNPQIIGELFYEQAKPWAGIVMLSKTSLLTDAQDTLQLILQDVADARTCDGLMRYIINPGLEPVKLLLNKKANEVLKPHQRPHPITYNHYLIDNIQKIRAQQWGKAVEDKLSEFFSVDLASSSTKYSYSFDVRSLANALKTVNTETNIDRYACSEAVGCMQAYYKVCARQIPRFSLLSS